MKTLKKMDGNKLEGYRVIDGDQFKMLADVALENSNTSQEVSGLLVTVGVTKVIRDAKLICMDGLRFTVSTNVVSAEFCLTYKEGDQAADLRFTLEMEPKDVPATTKVVFMP